MQQGAEGTERFCIKQLLKPVDNVSLLCCVLFVGSIKLAQGCSQVCRVPSRICACKNTCIPATYCCWSQASVRLETQC